MTQSSQYNPLEFVGLFTPIEEVRGNRVEEAYSKCATCLAGYGLDPKVLICIDEADELLNMERHDQIINENDKNVSNQFHVCRRALSALKSCPNLFFMFVGTSHRLANIAPRWNMDLQKRLLALVIFTFHLYLPL